MKLLVPEMVIPSSSEPGPKGGVPSRFCFWGLSRRETPMGSFLSNFVGLHRHGKQRASLRLGLRAGPVSEARGRRLGSAQSDPQAGMGASGSGVPGPHGAVIGSRPSGRVSQGRCGWSRALESS